jgi:hypothetical protein
MLVLWANKICDVYYSGDLRIVDKINSFFNDGLKGEEVFEILDILMKLRDFSEMYLVCFLFIHSLKLLVFNLQFYFKIQTSFGLRWKTPPKIKNK